LDVRKYICTKKVLNFDKNLYSNMDFLDPRRKRFQLLQLAAGYILVAIAIGLGTIILVYAAYGYSVNTKTGDIVENGLLFVDSKPGGAKIYLNGKPISSNTSARLVLPADEYDLKLTRDGYRDWERKFTLDEHSVARYVYPFLFPKEPVTAALKTYAAAPGLFTESPDRRWLLVQLPSPDQKTISFDQYDTGDLKKAPTTLTLPATTLSNASGTLTEVEWSTDNKHLLLQHVYAGGSEFIVLNRDAPETSFNVNKLFSVIPTEVALRNKKIDQLYVYDQAAGTLRLGDSGSGTLDVPIIKNVLAFKPYGNDIVNYVTDQNITSGQAQARIWNKGKTYPLFTFKAGTKYIVDAAGFHGSTYFIAGSNTSGKVNVYKDPLNNLQNPAIAKAIPVLALHANGAERGGFSTNTRFISIEGGQSFAVYDLETQSRYEYTLQSPLAGPLHWMDGHRLIGSSGGKVLAMDYDSTNQQALTPSSNPLGGYFDRDYNQMLSLAPVAGSNSVTLDKVDMRAGADLPKAQ
jgi:hypothetical protein